jgi:alpha-beta hydrolase superfamily lysophospholipase
VLIVEAGSDRIVEPQARTMLRAALPAAEVRTLPGVGHALLSDGVMANVIDWVESWRDAED